MKQTRFQYEYRKSASKYHKAVGDLLRTTFPYLQVYQEYPVNRVNVSYTESSHHFDWVLPSLQVVIEVHGQQHYKPTSWVGDADQAQENFRSLKERDELKRLAALSAGYRYIALPYSECMDLDQASLLNLIETAEVLANASVEAEEDPRKEKQKEKAKEKRQEYLKSDKHKEELEKAREWRKMQYKKAKERKANES